MAQDPATAGPGLEQRADRVLPQPHLDASNVRSRVDFVAELPREPTGKLMKKRCARGTGTPPARGPRVRLNPNTRRAQTVTKAIRFHEYGGPEVMKLEEIPRPVPKDDEILVRVHAMGVNPVDWKIREGHVRKMLDIPLPAIPGGDISGVVEEAGAQVSGFAVGQAVYAMIGPAGCLRGARRDQGGDRGTEASQPRSRACRIGAARRTDGLPGVSSSRAGSSPASVCWCTPPPVESADSPCSSRGMPGRKSLARRRRRMPTTCGAWVPST